MKNLCGLVDKYLRSRETFRLHLQTSILKTEGGNKRHIVSTKTHGVTFPKTISLTLTSFPRKFPAFLCVPAVSSYFIFHPVYFSIFILSSFPLYKLLYCRFLLPPTLLYVTACKSFAVKYGPVPGQLFQIRERFNFVLLSYPEEGCTTFLRHIGVYLANYTLQVTGLRNRKISLYSIGYWRLRTYIDVTVTVCRYKTVCCNGITPVTCCLFKPYLISFVTFFTGVRADYNTKWADFLIFSLHISYVRSIT
jgi:hypothetical protein